MIRPSGTLPRAWLLVALLVLPWGGLYAQAPRAISRADAIQAALAQAPRLLLAGSDTLAAAANALSARLFPDPVASIGYTESFPRYHAELSIPLDLPWIRSARKAAAESNRAGSQLRLAFARVAAQLDADTAYTAALAAHALLALSRRNTRDADSLLGIALFRNKEGDASLLDVELARVFAGQQANAYAADSLAAESTLLTLQASMGMADGEIAISLSDTLRRPPPDRASADTSPVLPIAAGEADVTTAELAAKAQRASWMLEPTLTAGIETNDPGGTENRILPLVGLALPLPLLNRNRGNVAIAEAEVQHARALLAAIRVESGSAIGRAQRAVQMILAQLTRDERMTVTTEHVSSMSLTAYREGAATLASVLEAQRMARDVRAQHIADLAAAWTARSVLMLLTETAAPRVP